jgi:hypothetical protein
MGFFHFHFRMSALGVALGAGAMLVGCTDPGDGQTGELGNGTFLYPCDTSTLHCDSAGHDSDLQAAPSSFYVASGSKFRFDFQRPANKADIDSLRPISKNIIGVSPDGYFTANREGWGGFYAVNPGGQLVDFSEVQIKKPATISINAHSQGDFTPDQNGFQTLSVQLVNGTDLPVFQLLANLHAADSSLLHGEVTFDWKVSDQTIAELSNTNGHMASLTAHKAGVVTLTVTSAGITRTATVEVQ